VGLEALLLTEETGSTMGAVLLNERVAQENGRTAAVGRRRAALKLPSSGREERKSALLMMVKQCL
jgi:hypothetical protein